VGSLASHNPIGFHGLLWGQVYFTRVLSCRYAAALSLSPGLGTLACYESATLLAPPIDDVPCVLPVASLSDFGYGFVDNNMPSSMKLPQYFFQLAPG
jgi:hypothetical protein